MARILGVAVGVAGTVLAIVRHHHRHDCDPVVRRRRRRRRRLLVLDHHRDYCRVGGRRRGRRRGEMMLDHHRDHDIVSWPRIAVGVGAVMDVLLDMAFLFVAVAMMHVLMDVTRVMRVAGT